MTNLFDKVKVVCALVVMGIGLAAYSAAPTVTSVTAQQRYPWNGLVDIAVTFNGAKSDVAKANCTFAATDNATKKALAVAHLTQQGSDAGSGTIWTRHFIWDTNADLGEVKIDDVELVADVEDDGSDGVQLWEGGPCWATCNVGASKPEEYGLYFWWGDTVGHAGDWAFSYANCPTYGKSISDLQSLGYIDSTGNLAPAHDAARAHWGSPWRMPTEAEFSALISNCDTQWTTRNGVNGQLVKGRGAYSSKSIFLPAAGVGYDDSGLNALGSLCIYWSSTPNSGSSNFAWLLYFSSSYFARYHNVRYGGQTVRPVRGFAKDAENTTSPVSSHLSLDNRTGTRVAAATERICFSPAWESATAGATAVVSTNGVAAKSATEAGAFDWTPAQNGTYQLTHAVHVNGVQVGETLTATFDVTGQADGYTIKFDANGGVDTGEHAMDDVCVPRNSKFKLPSCRFERKGYSFDGWAHSEIATFAEIEDGEEIENLTSFDEITLFAHWKGNKINVTFNRGPFSDTTEPTTVEYVVGTVFHDFPIHTRAGWNVKGWYTQPMGGDRYQPGDVLPFLEDGTLYLQADYIGGGTDPGGQKDELTIETTQLPSVMEMEEYEEQLECSGGTEPYWWSMDEADYLAVAEESTFAEVGEAQGWREDDGEWRYDLPFAFNFGGRVYDSVVVHDNACLYFVAGSNTDAIETNLGDLYSESADQDIFVERAADHVTFRWKRVLYSDRESEVNCSITLNADGTIRCAFGDSSYESRQVWLSTARDGAEAEQFGDDDIVFEPNYLPLGLWLEEETGLVYGAPEQAGHYAFDVYVSDGEGAISSKRVTLDVEANPNDHSSGYRIVFDARDGAGAMSVQIVQSACVYKLPKCTLKPPEGKTRFAGWAGSNGRRYDDEMLVFNLAQPGETVTMTAIWDGEGGQQKELGGVQLWEGGPYWAECNVGATKPEECGYYFWWGDTVGYKRNANNNGWISVKDSTKFSFVGGNCSTNDKGDSQLLSEGYIDASGNLGAVHDAATAHLGSPWRMPTDAEFSALINNCTTTWTTRNGVFGRLVTGKGVYSSKRIFLPAAGYGDDSSLTYLGSDGYYWSSTSYSDYSLYAWFLDFSSGYFCRLYNYRFLGQSVRPVRGFAK